MNEYYYNSILTRMPTGTRLFYCDTDSFYLWQVEGSNGDIKQSFKKLLFSNSTPCDIYSFIKNNEDLFDTSGFDQNNVFGITPTAVARVPGRFKVENANDIILEAVALRSKVEKMLRNFNADAYIIFSNFRCML